MEIEELEALLGITVPEAQKETYEARIKAAIDHINVDCGGRFTDPADTDKVILPEGVKMGAALLVKAMGENPGVSAKSLADMATSFFEGGTKKAARSYWRLYIRARYF